MNKPTFSWTPKAKRLGLSLFHWFFWVAVVGLLFPFVLVWVEALLSGTTLTEDLFLSRGDLYIAASLLSASGLGEVLSAETTRKLTKSFIGFVAFFDCFVSSVFFGDVTVKLEEHHVYIAKAVSQGSLWMFAIAVISAGVCHLVSEENKS